MSLTQFPNGISSMGVPLTGGINPFGEVWFVAASGGSDANSGLDTVHPLATIAKAISLGAAGDTIILGPGTHSVDVSASALIPKADMQFVAAIPPRGGKPSTIITHDADDGLVIATIDVDGVGFYGIEFLLVAGGTTALELVSASQTTAVNGLIFQDCWFNLASVDAGVEGLVLDDATNATTGLVVKNCRFLGTAAATGGAAVCMHVGVGGIADALIEDNVFALESADDDAIGINFDDPATGDPSYAAVIRNNDFISAKDGAASNVVAIKFHASMSAQEMVPMIRTNYFAGFGGDCITQDKVDNSVLGNYVGDTATGGTLVTGGS